jgi:hypothetical protein
MVRQQRLIASVFIYFGTNETDVGRDSGEDVPERTVPADPELVSVRIDDPIST